jgi:hypothetical protein
MKSTLLIGLLLFTGCDGFKQADTSCYCTEYEDGSSSCHCYDNDKESILEDERIAGNKVVDEGDMTLINEGKIIYYWEERK